MTAALYPEHEKLQAVSEKSQIIGEFLEFVRDAYGWHVCEWGMLWEDRLHWPQRSGARFPGEDLEPHAYVQGPPESRRHDIREEFMQVGETVEEKLARYFEIDLDVLEQEKRQMLEAMRRLNDAED